jgi:hypothetical protein
VEVLAVFVEPIVTGHEMSSAISSESTNFDIKIFYEENFDEIIDE